MSTNEVMSMENMTPEDIMIEILKNQKEQKQLNDSFANDIDYLKNEQPINPSTCREMEKRRKKTVIQFLGGKESQAYKNRSFANSVFRQAAEDFKEHFGIPRYDLLKRKDEKAGFDYWNVWEPSTNVKMQIQQMNNQTTLDLVG